MFMVLTELLLQFHFSCFYFLYYNNYVISTFIDTVNFLRYLKIPTDFTNQNGVRKTMADFG